MRVILTNPEGVSPEEIATACTTHGPFKMVVLFEEPPTDSPDAIVPRTKVEARISSADVSIDTITMTATVDGNDIALTPQQWCALRLLVANVGKTMSRENLSRSGNSPYDSRTVDVIISRIRKSFGPVGKKLIRTVRHGFMIPDFSGSR